MEENKSQKSTIKIVIITIVAMFIFVGFAYTAYEIYDDHKWDNFAEEHNRYDNLLYANCEMDKENKKIISCEVTTEEKIGDYESFTISITHSENIKYLSHDIPTENKLYTSHETSTGYSEKIKEYFYVSNLDEVSSLDYLINIKFEILDDTTEEELVFNTMTLIENDIYHHTDNVVIKINDLLEETPSEETKTEETTQAKYTYLCLNTGLAKDGIIYKNMLSECGSNEELAKDIISEKLIKEYGLALADSYTDTTYYLKTAKKANDKLSIEDIYWKLTSETKAELKTSTGTNYTVSIKDDKALYINSTMLFNQEKVKAFYVRPYCCAGNKKLIIVTEDNNTYTSDVNIDLMVVTSSDKLKDITFKNLNIKNVKEIRLNYYVPSMAGTHAYAIDTDGKEHLID